MGQSHGTETKPVVFKCEVAFRGGVRCECIPAGNLNGCQHCRPKLRPEPPFWTGTWPPIRPGPHVIRTGTSRRPPRPGSLVKKEGPTITRKPPLTTARKLSGTTARKHMVRGPPRKERRRQRIARRNQRTGTGVPGE